VNGKMPESERDRSKPTYTLKGEGESLARSPHTTDERPGGRQGATGKVYMMKEKNHRRPEQGKKAQRKNDLCESEGWNGKG